MSAAKLTNIFTKEIKKAQISFYQSGHIVPPNLGFRAVWVLVIADKGLLDECQGKELYVATSIYWRVHICQAFCNALDRHNLHNNLVR